MFFLFFSQGLQSSMFLHASTEDGTGFCGSQGALVKPSTSPSRLGILYDEILEEFRLGRFPRKCCSCRCHTDPFHTKIVCVCESNSVPKRSKPPVARLFCFSRRGTQEAHRAVSNEALYGVFRISGLITLTYLHW